MISQVQSLKILKLETVKILVLNIKISETQIMSRILRRKIKVVLLHLSIDPIQKEVLHHNQVTS
jgi:hypothetical protein